MSKIAFKNLWNNRKAIWKAMHTIGEADFKPQDAHWHHWQFQNNKLYKDGQLTPDDCMLEMWIKRV